jgi:carboxypeptidase C (cathepsin A)
MTNQKSKGKKSKKDKVPSVKPQKTTKKFQGSFGGTEVAYTATAATSIFEVNEKKAEFFYVAYTRDDVDPTDRPVLFCFNGGPGSSTVWLHLGLFGPKRMEFDDDGFKIGMQGRLIDNEHSILDVSDVVCVDAIGTGFSTTVKKKDEEDFHHFKHDIEAFSHFIVNYLNANGRWASPKYLAGESYGTLRGAGIANDLLVNHGVEFNGIVLISTILNYQTSAIGKKDWMVHPGNDLPFALYLPTYAATAWYHGLLSKQYQSMSLRDFLDEVEEFALGDYWLALARGDRLEDDVRKDMVSRVAGYTGLGEEYVERYDLRIHILRFCKELLRDQRRTVGRIDSRYVGIGKVADGDNMEADPSLDATGAVATSALNTYLRDELGFEADKIYKIMSMKVNERWNYEDFKNRYVDTSEKMRELMTRSPGTKVLAANGYYDLATPHFATEYTFSHMGLDPELRPNVRMEYYEAGHMMYVHLPSLQRLAGHLREFVEETQ